MNLIERAPWIISLILLSSVLTGGALIVWQPDWLAGALIAVVLGAGFLWVAVSVFWPARADRRCPRCGEEALERLDPDTTTGLRCTACEFVDEDASGWFLAEDEGPLEELVLRGRGRGSHTGER